MFHIAGKCFYSQCVKYILNPKDTAKGPFLLVTVDMIDADKHCNFTLIPGMFRTEFIINQFLTTIIYNARIVGFARSSGC